MAVRIVDTPASGYQSCSIRLGNAQMIECSTDPVLVPVADRFAARSRRVDRQPSQSARQAETTFMLMTALRTAFAFKFVTGSKFRHRWWWRKDQPNEAQPFCFRVSNNPCRFQIPWGVTSQHGGQRRSGITGRALETLPQGFHPA